MCNTPFLRVQEARPFKFFAKQAAWPVNGSRLKITPITKFCESLEAIGALL